MMAFPFRHFTALSGGAGVSPSKRPVNSEAASIDGQLDVDDDHDVTEPN
jgi:hypothetical protein